MINLFSNADRQKPTIISGTAYNAKAGAVIETSSGRVVYVKNLPEWDDEQIGKQMKLKGIIRKESIFPGTIAPDGAVRQGMDDLPWVIELSEFAKLKK